MKRLLPCLLLVLALSACDRRDIAPRETSETTDTVIIDPGATVPDQTGPLPPPATSPCAGLSGAAEAECRAREQQSTDPTRSGEPTVDPAELPEDARKEPQG